MQIYSYLIWDTLHTNRRSICKYIQNDFWDCSDVLILSHSSSWTYLTHRRTFISNLLLLPLATHFSSSSYIWTAEEWCAFLLVEGKCSILTGVPCRKHLTNKANVRKFWTRFEPSNRINSVTLGGGEIESDFARCVIWYAGHIYSIILVFVHTTEKWFDERSCRYEAGGN